MINLTDIEVKFGDFTALKDINIHVREGQFYTFLGPSGCGKTTTLRTITGFIKPVKGRVIVKGKDITDTPVEKRNIGMVFQNYALFPTMSVYENIAFGLRVSKVEKSEIDRRVREMAKKVELNEKQLMRKVAELSGGQQQRVAIARALVNNPAIICLDEPLSNLDAKLRVQLRGELKEMQKNFGITTVYVTHDQEDINRLQPPLLHQITEQTGTPLDFEKASYVRLERVHMNMPAASGFASFNAKVVSREYYGLYIKYTLSLGSQTLKAIERNDGTKYFEAGEQVTVFIKPDDLMVY